VYLVNRGVQIAIRPTWAFQDVPIGAFWWKQPSSPGRAELAWASWATTTSLFSPINRGRRAEQIRSTLLEYEIHLKLVIKIDSVKKIQAEALP